MDLSIARDSYGLHNHKRDSINSNRRDCIHNNISDSTSIHGNYRESSVRVIPKSEPKMEGVIQMPVINLLKLMESRPSSYHLSVSLPRYKQNSMSHFSVLVISHFFDICVTISP